MTPEIKVTPGQLENSLIQCFANIYTAQNLAALLEQLENSLIQCFANNPLGAYCYLLSAEPR